MAIMHLGWQSVPKVAIGVETIPVGSTVYVAGGGYAYTNGTYTYLQDSSYTKGFGPYINHVGGEWRITNFDDSDRHYYNTNGNANNLPLTGWQVGTAAAPAPTISA
jgi:predicted membrane channel-forming protein YqfA (hemolysin III family)